MANNRTGSGRKGSGYTVPLELFDEDWIKEFNRDGDGYMYIGPTRGLKKEASCQ
jgi:hypothetical protein